MIANEFQPLTNKNIENYIGKTINWRAPAYDKNNPYHGVAVIQSVDLSVRRGIKCKTIEGDDLEFAFLDTYGLSNDNEGYSLTYDNRVFCYSDSFREVFFIEVSPNQVK